MTISRSIGTKFRLNKDSLYEDTLVAASHPIERPRPSGRILASSSITLKGKKAKILVSLGQMPWLRPPAADDWWAGLLQGTWASERSSSSGSTATLAPAGHGSLPDDGQKASGVDYAAAAANVQDCFLINGNRVSRQQMRQQEESCRHPPTGRITHKHRHTQTSKHWRRRWNRVTKQQEISLQLTTEATWLPRWLPHSLSVFPFLTFF